MPPCDAPAEWIVPADRDIEVPTNLVVFSTGLVYGLGIEGTMGEQIGLQPSAPLGAVAVLRPTAELEPYTTYTLHAGTEVFFGTGGGPLTVAPQPPVVTEAEEPPCEAELVLDVVGEGALVVVDPGGRTTEADPFTGATILPRGALAFDRYVGVVPDGDIEEVRVGLVDATGAWSGWSDAVPLRGGGAGDGCGCRTAGATPFLLGALGLLGRRRR